MSRSTIAIAKFVGCISLGLLTGTSYTLSTLSLPPLLSLPSAPLASSTLSSLRARTRTHQRVLSALSIAALGLAYILSPRKGRHPYLVWTALTVGLSAGAGFLLEETDAKREDDGRVNGEVVRERVEGWRWGQGVRGGVAAVAWGMCVVGIWGDGV